MRELSEQTILALQLPHRSSDKERHSHSNTLGIDWQLKDDERDRRERNHEESEVFSEFAKDFGLFDNE